MSFIVKNTTIINPFDLIAPHSCRGCGRLGEPLCNCCKNDILKLHSTFHKDFSVENLPPLYTLGPREGLLSALIYDYKYNSNRALGKTFAELLDTILPPSEGKTFIVPLPTAHHHIRARALDHTLKIAKHLAKKRHLEVASVLVRAKDTVQVGADRATRLQQAGEAYALNQKISIDPTATYILLDDVWTTGTSLLSATKKLREAGALKIDIAVLAISS